jgi:hypothetical protein
MREIYVGEDLAAQQSREFLASTAQRGVALSEAILAARPQACGALPDIDPRLLHVALLGACTYFATAQPLFDVLFEGEPEVAQRYVEFMTDLVLRGIGVQV